MFWVKHGNFSGELYDLIRFCRNVEEDKTTDINVNKTLTYISVTSQTKSLLSSKDNRLIAIPFYKEICFMSIENYYKLNDIIQLPQFEKVQPKRNEKHPILKKELASLKKLKESNTISESIYNSLKPTGSQPARLYGQCQAQPITIYLLTTSGLHGSFWLSFFQPSFCIIALGRFSSVRPESATSWSINDFGGLPDHHVRVSWEKDHL